MIEPNQDPEEPEKEINSLLERATALHDGNDFDAAEPIYLSILQKDSRHFTATHLLGVLNNQRGDFQTAMDLLQRALALNPRSALAHLNLGLSFWNQERYTEALRHFRMARRLDPKNQEALFNCAMALQTENEPDEAILLWDQLIALSYKTPEVLLNRGMALQDLHQPAEAQADFDRALSLNSDLSELLLKRARKLNQDLRCEESLSTLDQILTSRPDWIQAHIGRAAALATLNRPKDALVCLDLALLLDPNNPEAMFSRANPLMDLGRPQEALATAERALAIQPHCISALQACGCALESLNRFSEALGMFDQALSFEPEWIGGLMNRGVALHALGRHHEALATWDKALTLEPDRASILSAKLILMDYLPGIGFEEGQGARRTYYLDHAKRFEAQHTPFPNDRDPNRRLVVGYVSADFKNHATASIFLPIFQRHSKSDFQINCYSNSPKEDDWTQCCRDCSDLWRQCHSMTDDALADQIRDDGVDILVDLSGHTACNRLLVFARKPAPIQVSAWGHGEGTGLPMVDYLFADPVAIPPTVRHLFAEQVFDLPCHITFEAPCDEPLVPLPASSNGHITFGCLNRYSKVTPEVECLWADILHAVPKSKILFKSGLFDDHTGQKTVLEAFQKLGIPAERIILRGASSRREHLVAFGDVDIMLDPFPQNGGITTMESLWMGTPVVAKLGTNLPSRAAGAILHALGFCDWVAEDERGYLEIAVQKAADIQGLAHFRQTTRSKMLASPAGNADLYTRAVETAYRAMWQKWAASS